MKFSKGILKDVYFYYTCIRTPINKYQSDKKEFKTSVAVTKEQYNEFVSQFPRTSKKIVTNDDFLSEFKTEPPFPEQPAQYILTLRKDELNKDGQPYEVNPKAYLEDNSGTIYDITEEHNIGNGSKGDLHYYYFTTSNGTFAKLSEVKITKLIKYESTGASLSAVAKQLPKDSEIDANIVDAEDSTDKPIPAAPSENKAAPKQVTDDQLPF